MVTDYLEGILEPGTRRAIEDHVGTCHGCAEYLSQMRSTIRIAPLLRPA